MADCFLDSQTHFESTEDSLALMIDKTNDTEFIETTGDFLSATPTAKTIQAIDKTSVHKICSGQVVLTLATAVKELVENSIDAGATTVEIKLKEYGSESIEVSDNGHGVDEANFEGLTLKHHTSKLQDFEDLVNVTTFGFRGEALSSLCALSNMTIVTRHQTAAVGTKLEFDLNGRIVSRRSAPRQVGTTVLIQNIFHTLPVRYKEFQKNLKKEFAKLVQVLNGYCIINTGVRVSCFHQTGKGSRSAVVTTNGNVLLRDNISNVFGPKQLSSLLEFRQWEARDDICEDYGIKPQQKPGIKFQVEGFVSKCEHGQGRGTTDRQFIFINRRPCDSSKILKVVNEVYHGYNRHQYPFIVLCISMDKESVDVNVTPDKRQIFLEGEPYLLAVIKTSLLQMFEPTSSVYRVNNVLSSPHPVNSNSESWGDNSEGRGSQNQSFPNPGCSVDKSRISTDSPSLSDSVAKLKRSFSSAFSRNSPTSPVSRNRPTSPVSSLKKPKSGFSSFLSTKSSIHTSDKSSIAHIFSISSVKSTKTENNSAVENSDRTDSNTNSDQCPQANCATDEVFETGASDIDDSLVITQPGIEDEEICCVRHDSLPCCDSSANENFSFSPPYISPNLKNKNSLLKVSFHELSSENQTDVQSIISNKARCDDSGSHDDVEKSQTESVKCFSDSRDDTSIAQHAIHPQLDSPSTTSQDLKRLEKTLPFSMARLKEDMAALTLNDSTENFSFSRCFRAKINPADNSSAEDELKRSLSKDMFAKMNILGQFNLGFIIAKHANDLFIIDQHATDEKYNFEMLQRNTVLQSQRMISPQNIELTASNEAILVDNLDVFKKNGFDFIVDKQAPPTQRVKLVSAPVSKNWRFGKDDIEELIFMLTDSPNVMCRPTRIRMMFASRACRKSVMIGTALSHSEMRRLVNHMGDLDQPWNCPHGRPTMRHLFNMDMLPS
ncbi:Mismatch repair endonuclease pms2 [Bulinus truncatus]|nr:Mismatch repair endonuclease pms2 [Bulinus truncatus]